MEIIVRCSTNLPFSLWDCFFAVMYSTNPSTVDIFKYPSLNYIIIVSPIRKLIYVCVLFKTTACVGQDFVFVCVGALCRKWHRPNQIKFKEPLFSPTLFGNFVRHCIIILYDQNMRHLLSFFDVPIRRECCTIKVRSCLSRRPQRVNDHCQRKAVVPLTGPPKLKAFHLMIGKVLWLKASAERQMLNDMLHQAF